MRHPKGAILKKVQPWRLDGVLIAVGIFQKVDGTSFSTFVEMSEDGTTATRLLLPPSVLFYEPMVWRSIAESMSAVGAPLVSQPPANGFNEPTMKN